MHEQLYAFTVDAGVRLDLAAAGGDEVPFEVVQSDRGRSQRIPLYCYRPLTGDFIRARFGLLTALATYAPVARALAGVGGLELYLRARGRKQMPDDPRGLAQEVLGDFVARVFHERSEFTLDEARFQAAYEELERAIYEGRCVTEVVAALLGIDLDPKTGEIALGDGLSIVRWQALAGAPPELATGEHPPLLLVLRVAHDRLQQPSIAFARTRFRRALTAVRLFEKGGYAIGPIGYSRVDDGVWSPIALGASGRPRLLTLIPRQSEDEFRAFCNLIGRRLPGAGGRGLDNSGAGELAWALSRFEMGCERVAPFEALTDYLLSLRALLEPEGPGSGRLAQRLAMICAGPDERAALAERTAHAISLERAVIAGLAPEAGVDTLVAEIAEHLRAILRDVLCGHLDADVRGVADALLAETAQAAAV